MLRKIETNNLGPILYAIFENAAKWILVIFMKCCVCPNFFLKVTRKMRIIFIIIRTLYVNRSLPLDVTNKEEEHQETALHQNKLLQPWVGVILLLTFALVCLSTPVLGRFVCVTIIIRDSNNTELMFLYVYNKYYLYYWSYSVEFLLLKLSELSCSECSICLGLAVSHLQMFFYWGLLYSVCVPSGFSFILHSEWELAAPMYLSTQCSSSLIGLR